MELKYLDVRAFIISFALGMFAVYILEPDTTKIKVYPSPDNNQYIQYKDEANNCFTFRQSSISCPKDKTNIYETPIQSN